MSYETVLFERKDRIAIITLNRPEAMNAVNATLWSEAGRALEDFENDPDLWVAIITGAGDKSFSAGADLKELAAGRKIQPDDEKEKSWGFGGIAEHFVSKPVIAAVNGFALGGGTEIALACDLVVASENAKFGLPEVKRGLTAAAGGLLRLPRQIPLKKAMEIILTGEAITAQEALELGLINQVSPHEQVVETAIALAEKICENAPVSVRISKEVVYRGLDKPLTFPNDAWEVSREYTQKIYDTEDFKEGTKAFAEKRKPNWKGY